MGATLSACDTVMSSSDCFKPNSFMAFLRQLHAIKILLMFVVFNSMIESSTKALWLTLIFVLLSEETEQSCYIKAK